MATVGNVKIVICEKIVLVLHPHVDVRTVWLLHNLSLDDQLCLRDSKNVALASPSLAFAGKHVKHHARRAQKRQADFDWLNPHSLGTISTFDSIANLAENSTCLINYQEITRSI